MFPQQMKTSILAGALALSYGATADIPGAFVVQEARIADPTTNIGTLRQNFGYGGIAVVGDIDGDGIKDLIAGAPSNDSGSLVILKIGKDGKVVGSPSTLSARDPLVAPKLGSARERWGTSVAVAQEFSVSNPCAVVVTNSGTYMKLWAMKVCKDQGNVPYLNAVNMIDSTTGALGCVKSMGVEVEVDAGIKPPFGGG